MTINEVRKRYEARPFRPFTLHLADGREAPVPHPEFLALDPSERTVVVYQPEGGVNIVDLELVTDIEIKPTHFASRRRK